MREVLETPEAVAQRGAELLTESVLASSGPFNVLLSGGRTPKVLYEILATSPYKEKIPWERVRLFWGDERVVPPDHKDSNYGMVRAALISKVSIPKENIFRVPTELRDPTSIAYKYQETLKDYFRPRDPQFDFVFLGMGADGHTASLFPDSNYVDLSNKRNPFVIAPFVRSLNMERISVTLTTINNSKKIVFLVTGSEKAPVLKNLTGLPASFVAPTKGQLIWLLDKDASI